MHQAQSNALVCRICEKDHKNESELRTHMRQYHRACEMPYVCQLCNFRSSFYSDIVDHFKKVVCSFLWALYIQHWLLLETTKHFLHSFFIGFFFQYEVRKMICYQTVLCQCLLATALIKQASIEFIYIASMVMY